MDGLVVILATMVPLPICRILIGLQEAMSEFGKLRQTSVVLAGGQFGVWKIEIMNTKVRIRVYYDRQSLGFAIISFLLILLYLIILAFGQREVNAATSQTSQTISTNMQQFYLTKQAFPGDEALTACTTGYHMASLWEILDTSNLRYNTTLGFTRDDSGQGPVIGAGGWVRTGFSNDTSSTPGKGNCDGWASSDSDDYGTAAYLPYLDWTTGGDVGVWKTETDQCNASWWSVWCVENVGYTIYLPIVLRH